MKQIFSYFWTATKDYRYYYAFMLLAPIIASFYKPVVFYAIKLIIDELSLNTPISFSHLIKPIVIYIIIDVAVSGVWRISSILSYKSEPLVKQQLMLSSLNKILSFNYTFFQNNNSGMITSKLKGILDGYNNIWAQLYYGLSFILLGTLTIIGSVLLVNPMLGIVLILWSLVYLLFNYHMTKKINTLSETQNIAKHRIIGNMSDVITNILTIKLFSLRSLEIRKLKQDITNDYIPKQIKFTKFQIWVSIFNDIMGIIIITTMIIMIFNLRNKNLITLGGAVFILGIIVQFQDSLWRLIQQLHLLSDQLGDFKSSLSIIQDNNSEYNNQQLKIDTTNYNIEFKNVYFGYTSDKVIFDNLNLSIKSGQKIGLIGYTGSGKTSLINLLLKNFSPNAGSITINNIDIHTLDNDYLRGLITVVPQDISLFHRSILENIRAAYPTATDSEVIAASNLANAHEFITAMPQGYHTIVGERGLKLSGGQRQRIAIARAILKNSPILILDEATSSLDNVTEKQIQEAIFNLIAHKTVIAIAHRLTTLQNMDKLIVLNNGMIVEEGSHATLITNKNSLYHKIWAAQI